jgi:hypothetical protein
MGFVTTTPYHTMTAMKKTTSRTKTSPAPAIKKSKTTAKKKNVISSPRGLPVEPASKAVVPLSAKRTTPTPSATVITAVVDVGFGNTLYLRGEGPGLSWNRGIVMTCLAEDQWEVRLPESADPVVFKFLINDVTWCVGPDFKIASGESGKFQPGF